MKCLVTGGTGFIGKNLVEHLITQNHEVKIVDRISESRVRQIFNTSDFPFEYFKADVSEESELMDAMKGTDVVYHLAAKCEVNHEDDDFEKDTFGTTESVLNVMKKCSVKNLLFTSTSAVYGYGINSHKETDKTNPVSEYGIAKVRSEELIYKKALIGDVKATIFRMANVVGPGQTHGIVFDFVNNLKKDNSELLIKGNGKQTKEYIHIFDVLGAIDHVFKLSGPNIDIYNISNDSRISVIEIADIVCRSMNLENVNYVTEKSEYGWKGDIPYFSLDITKICQSGWKWTFNSSQAISDSAYRLL